MARASSTSDVATPRRDGDDGARAARARTRSTRRSAGRAARAQTTARARASASASASATRTRRAMLATPPAVLAATLAIAATPRARAEGKQDRGCETCSDSNSAMSDGDKVFVVSASGLRYLDLKVGDGAEAAPGKRAVIDWVGYTAGYQAKKIESTRETDEPFVFTIGRR